MSRVFWDTNLFIYLLEGNDARTNRVRDILERSLERKDALFTSHLVLGEMMAGAKKFGGEAYRASIRVLIAEMGFSCLPFDGGAVDSFSWLRSMHRTKVADSIHLACAASAGIDLFITGDTNLPKLDVPGIQFIVNYQSSFF